MTLYHIGCVVFTLNATYRLVILQIDRMHLEGRPLVILKRSESEGERETMGSREEEEEGSVEEARSVMVDR